MSEVCSRRAAMLGSTGLIGMTGLLTSGGLAQVVQKKTDGHATAIAGGPILASLTAAVGPGGEYVLPPLTYEYDALEPTIDAETMKLHHDKHHAAYVKGANDALAKLADIRAGKLDPAAVSEWSEKLSFNLSGHLLHAVFWANMSPRGGQPEGTLAVDINTHFGSLDKLKAHFSAAATQVQGNGWAVLAYESMSRRLIILQVRNHQLNVAWAAIPLLVLDVWEHAYYLKYKNVRADYVTAFWGIANWKAVDQWYGLVKDNHHPHHAQAH